MRRRGGRGGGLTQREDLRLVEASSVLWASGADVSSSLPSSGGQSRL